MDIVEGMWIKEWKGDKNKMKIYINKKKGGRQLVNCELVEDREHTILVRLSVTCHVNVGVVSLV